MHTDLPTAIREALRDREITEDDLRYSGLREPRRGVGGFVAAAAAVACVAAVAVVLATVNWRGSDGGAPAAGGGGFADVLGYKWRVTGLVDAQGELAVPNAHGAVIGYTHDGYASGSDSVNFFGAHYEATATGYSVSDATTTLVGYEVGPDEQRLIDAVDAMFFTVAESADRPARSVDVTVALDGDTLTLITGDTALTLVRAGEQPERSTMTEATPSATG